MLFFTYLADATVSGTPCDDFIEIARRDCQMPDVQSWPELHRYLIRVGATDAEIQAARLVWRDYEAAHADNAQERSGEVPHKRLAQR